MRRAFGVDADFGAEAGHGSIIHEGDVFEVIADNLSITEVMVLLDKAIVEGR
ncbi:MAG: hypothetical protein JRJ77_19185 [Deltaproteobacteria bacterium]|nr:hypothetical protein [Deltaproteobacteria bacterium]